MRRREFISTLGRDVAVLSLDVRFSNRPFGVKHFQTIHQCGVDVARGLLLLFGIGTWALPPWDPRTRRNNLLDDLAVSVTAGPSGHTNSPHPSSRKGHLSTARWSSKFSPIGFDPERFSCCCRGLFAGAPELGAVNPDAVQDHFQPASQSHDRLFYSDLEAEVAQSTSQIILNGDGLRLQKLAMGQQHSQFLAAERLHMHRTVQSHPDHLSDAARVIA